MARYQEHASPRLFFPHLYHSCWSFSRDFWATTDWAVRQLFTNIASLFKIGMDISVSISFVTKFEFPPLIKRWRVHHLLPLIELEISSSTCTLARTLWYTKFAAYIIQSEAIHFSAPFSIFVLIVCFVTLISSFIIEFWCPALSLCSTWRHNCKIASIESFS